MQPVVRRIIGAAGCTNLGQHDFRWSCQCVQHALGLDPSDCLHGPDCPCHDIPRRRLASYHRFAPDRAPGTQAMNLTRRSLFCRDALPSFAMTSSDALLEIDGLNVEGDDVALLRNISL